MKGGEDMAKAKKAEKKSAAKKTAKKSKKCK